MPQLNRISPAWTVLDEFTHGGERYMFVRRRNPTDLTKREIQVLLRAAQGETNKEIAFALGVAYSTVRVLLHRAARKLGADSRSEAIAQFESLRR